MREKKFFVILAFASLCVCASVSAQDKIPVTLASDTPETGVAVNPFKQNWEVGLGIQGLSFYSNQENFLDRPMSMFASHRTNISFAGHITKWFSPEIAVRAKATGFWGRSVVGNDKTENAISYAFLQGQALVNVSNIIWDYNATRKWNIIPYAGVGAARNFSYHNNSLVISVGLQGNYRILPRLKGYAEVFYNLVGDDFDGVSSSASNWFARHDRWGGLELGVIYELGTNRWKKVIEMDKITVVPYKETVRDLNAARQLNSELEEELEEERNKPAKVVTKRVLSVSDVSIFFEIGSSELQHRGQLENIKKLISVAKKYNRTLIVTGYADSQTGNDAYNERLSAARADCVAREIEAMGLDRQYIQVVTGGGVNTLNPVPANRRVVVSLKKDK